MSEQCISYHLIEYYIAICLVHCIYQTFKCVVVKSENTKKWKSRMQGSSAATCNRTMNAEYIKVAYELHPVCQVPGQLTIQYRYGTFILLTFDYFCRKKVGINKKIPLGMLPLGSMALIAMCLVRSHDVIIICPQHYPRRVIVSGSFV